MTRNCWHAAGMHLVTLRADAVVCRGSAASGGRPGNGQDDHGDQHCCALSWPSSPADGAQRAEEVAGTIKELASRPGTVRHVGTRTRRMRCWPSWTGSWKRLSSCSNAAGLRAGRSVSRTASATHGLRRTQADPAILAVPMTTRESALWRVVPEADERARRSADIPAAGAPGPGR